MANRRKLIATNIGLLLVLSGRGAFASFRVGDSLDREASLPRPYFGETSARGAHPQLAVSADLASAPRVADALPRASSSDRGVPSRNVSQPRKEEAKLNPGKLYDYGQYTAMAGAAGVVGAAVSQGVGAPTVAAGLAGVGWGVVAGGLLIGAAAIFWAARKGEMPGIAGYPISLIYASFGTGLGLLISSYAGAPAVLGTAGVYTLAGTLALGLGLLCVGVFKVFVGIKRMLVGS